jgi:hypothetical protein
MAGPKSKGRFTLRWRRPPVGQECLAKTWLYEANGGCAGEELKAIKYFLRSLDRLKSKHLEEKFSGEVHRRSPPVKRSSPNGEDFL